MSTEIPSGLAPGRELPPLALEPVNRALLAMFGCASGDLNPIHLDIDFARKAGMPDVFAQGMLGMAWMARAITAWVPQDRLRKFDARFLGITHLGHRITVTATVKDVVTFNGETCARIELRNTNQHGQTRIAGEALVAVG
ncbi:MaoC/PaaZ C-terminal domain-containing protein [Niveispirillum sp.]|uniref:MaoC/PaaZ C-terminal domain-containing protein n=1 Tax=Niveispirillum sp. TaxID=1917217 RepID=UPI001B59FA2A|nr:MaoC/PaaZ C-terminal domain-containing protein [Niveispirillum sp.]MBP7334297.1 dehydratase [Niveispirillum sp.]